MPTEFTTTRRVQFAETDMAGIVHFSHFFRYMEECEHAVFRSVGLSKAMPQEGQHIGWPRVTASCDFSGPVRFEDEVELKLRVVKVGDKSFSYEVEFLVAGRRVALGKTTSVCCVLADGRMQAIPIPPAIRAKLVGAPPATAG
jgi:YbgC/YbaW family acyl-CoA thioester hydrolase